MKKIFLFVCLFLFSCQNEYVEFHQNKEKQIQLQTQINDFSFEQIQYLSGITLKNTPDLKLLDDITTKIENANSRVYVEVYIFTEKRMKKSLIDAKKRGVEVKVILEKNIYLAGNLNKDTFKDLQTAGVEVVYSNPENYALNHTKMMIIDDEVVLSTGNYSYSTFKYNREFFIFLKNNEILGVFLEIFENDFIGNKKNIYHSNLVLSPFSSRKKLEYILKNAGKSIHIYAHNFSDEAIMSILFEQQKNGIDLKMIFPDLKKVASNKDEIEILKEKDIKIQIVDKPEIHTKAILVDDLYLYIGSINFSSYSIDKNREIGILIKNEDIIKQFRSIFSDDFQK